MDIANLVTMGRIGRLYGIKGWLKLISYTDPQDNILDFRNLFANIGGQWQAIEMDQCKVHGKGLIAHFAGYDDPDEARSLTGVELAVHVDDLPELDAEDFYWHELVGMRVETEAGQFLGTVAKLLETGANDVLVIAAVEGSVDDKERLVPYLPDRVIKLVSRAERRITVDWDPDYLV
ncbi:MAG: ribosome maturation factor RimM [Gammaproteobacteria bacterium]|nr:ribosome maturation factor RimM [Gammaproteobacteria bacterium]MDP2140519.1 ribosome maturation factor RimM [Gammaproteobacteria bacterium]MDP2348828.1 ribosome maturation factor RimM [Gammaproteobacteria bacterium]